MKINRNNYAKECSDISMEIDQLKNKLIINKNDERILDSGLTTNSKFYFEIIEFKPLESTNQTKFVITVDGQSSELDINDANIKRIMNLYFALI
jgi:hypothetical protein